MFLASRSPVDSPQGLEPFMSNINTGALLPPKARTSGQSCISVDERSLHQETPKNADLARHSIDPGEHMTTNQGMKIGDDQNSLKAGPRGPMLLQDFHFREKMTHFNQERARDRTPSSSHWFNSNAKASAMCCFVGAGKADIEAFITA